MTIKIQIWLQIYSLNNNKKQSSFLFDHFVIAEFYAISHAFINYNAKK